MEDEIMCTSVYLKTAIVGMHNNALQLTEKQRIVRRLIDVIGERFRVSYSPVSRPDFVETTTLQGCIGRTVYSGVLSFSPC